MNKVLTSRPKQQEWQVGDYFLVPLLDRKHYGIGQIVKYVPENLGSVACIFFAIKVKDKEEALEKIKNLSEEDIIVAQLTNPGFLYGYSKEDGKFWEVVAHGEVKYLEGFFDLKRINSLKTPVRAIGLFEKILSAYHGLYPWDPSYSKDPEAYTKLLVSPDKKPADVKYEKDFPEYNQPVVEPAPAPIVKKKRTRRKRQAWKEGDYFLIGLVDGSYTIGQVVKFLPHKLGSIACLYFDARVKDKAEALARIPTLTEKEVISAQLTTTDCLDWYDEYYWEVISSGEIKYIWNFFDPYRLQSVGTSIEGSGNINDLINGYYGLSPWDWAYDVDYFDKLLVSPSKKPSNLKYKKDFDYQPDGTWKLKESKKES